MRLLGQERLVVALLVPGRRRAVHRHVDRGERVGSRHRPVAARREHRARALQVAERVLPRVARRAEERQGELDHLRFERRPQRLHVRHDAELAEACDVVGMHDLQVRDVVAVVVAPVRRDRMLHRVEALAHRSVADRVEVQLEAEGVEARRGLVQELGRHERDARVVGRVAVPVAVRLEHGRREVLGHPVLHDLDARGGEAAAAVSLTLARRASRSARARRCDPTRARRPRGR